MGVPELLLLSITTACAAMAAVFAVLAFVRTRACPHLSRMIAETN
jgi:hypothetical protein